MNKFNKLFEVRDSNSGRHLDYICAPDRNVAQATFEYTYINEDGTTSCELHECRNIKAAAGRDSKAYIF